jgi:hypothetical protein
MRRPDELTLPDGPADQAFQFGGYPFYFADTRTGRSARGSHIATDVQRILSKLQSDTLKKWLSDHRDHVKFIATPSLLLPRRRTTAEDANGCDHSDAWDGFPASLEELLGFIAAEEIRNTVFLSGDEHHSLYTEIWVQAADESTSRVKVVSVHSSGLYTPFPFANGHPLDLVRNESFNLGRLKLHVQATPAPAGDGYARLGVSGPPRQPNLEIVFVRGAEPSDSTAHAVSLN